MIAPRTTRWPWRLILAVPLIAAIVHIIATLMAASDPSQSAYTRLAANYPLHSMTALPRIGPDTQVLPFLSADARYAICVFDTRRGPLTVTGPLPDLGWTMGVFRADGSSGYFAAAAPGQTTNVALKIIANKENFLGLTPQAMAKPKGAEPYITVEAERGFVVWRGPDKGPSYASETENVLAQAGCKSETY